MYCSEFILVNFGITLYLTIINFLYTIKLYNVTKTFPIIYHLFFSLISTNLPPFCSTFTFRLVFVPYFNQSLFCYLLSF